MSLALIEVSVFCNCRFLFVDAAVEWDGTHPGLGLTFIGTDPLHERRGAASLLLQWGLQRCNQDNVPAYLESTVDAAPLYERLGFTSVGSISMVLKGGEGESIMYEEVCLIFRPLHAS